MPDLLIHFDGKAPKELTVLVSGDQSLCFYKNDGDAISIARKHVRLIPSGHGRLIDVDEVIKILESLKWDGMSRFQGLMLDFAINTLTNAAALATIIPADGKVTP